MREGHAIELAFTKTGKLGMLQFSLFYRHTIDIVRRVANGDTLMDTRQVTAISLRAAGWAGRASWCSRSARRCRKDRGTISLLIQDPFNTMQMSVRTGDDYAP